jgi:hypothetical protein
MITTPEQITARRTLALNQGLILTPIWQLPFGKGQRFLNNGSLVNAIAGGWEVSGIVIFQTGFAFTVIADQDFSNTGSFSPRPDRIAYAPSSNRFTHITKPSTSHHKMFTRSQRRLEKTNRCPVEASRNERMQAIEAAAHIAQRAAQVHSHARRQMNHARSRMTASTMWRVRGIIRNPKPISAR